MNAILNLAIPVVGALIALLVIGVILAKLYVKTTTETAYIRTGGKSKKVVINGGSLVIPLIHSVMWVNMQSLKLGVQRKDKQSLVTGDYLRADVDVDFHVRVGAEADNVAMAAMTLGRRTLNVDQMREFIEPKLVDVLRSVAATMTLSELHQQRAEFVKKVREAVAPVLEGNGLVLESVSLTALNQTEKRWFDVENVMDAQGLAQMTQTVEASRKQINDVEQTNAVAIEQRNLEAARQRAQIERETAEVGLTNKQEIARMTAERNADIAATTAEGQRREQLAVIASEREVALERTEAERKTREAQLAADRSVKEAQLAADRSVKEAQLAADTAVKLKAQDQAIAVAERSKAEAAAEAAANEARAAAVATEEQVTTARQVEIANREKAVAVVAAEKRAQEGSIGVVVAAKAEQDAADARAEAVRRAAEAERDAALLRAEGTLAEGEANAKALELANAAENVLSTEMQALRARLAFIQALPEAIRESVAPMHKIDSIRIAQVGGLTGNGGGTGAGNGGGSGAFDPIKSVVDGALSYRAQKPVIDGLVAEVLGTPGATLETMLGAAAQGAQLNTAAPAAVQASTDAPAAPAAVASDTSAQAERAARQPRVARPARD